MLSAIDMLPLEEPVDRHYGAIRNDLERVGRPIGRNDLLIAAHAGALDVTPVTDNVGGLRTGLAPGEPGFVKVDPLYAISKSVVAPKQYAAQPCGCSAADLLPFLVGSEPRCVVVPA